MNAIRLRNNNNVLISGLAVVRLPYHRHFLTDDCTVCRVQQESQDEKFIQVIDADDRRLLKSKLKGNFDEIGGPTWRNDEALKAWRYDDETNSWHNSDEDTKPRQMEEPINQESESSDTENNSSTDQVDAWSQNNELQLYSENHGTYIEGTNGNNELDYYGVDSIDVSSQ